MLCVYPVCQDLFDRQLVFEILEYLLYSDDFLYKRSFENAHQNHLGNRGRSMISGKGVLTGSPC